MATATRAKPADDKAPPSIPAQSAKFIRTAARDAATGAYPLTAQATPPAALGVLVLAAAATRAAVDATAGDTEILIGTAGACFVIAVVAATVTQARIGDKKSRRRAQAFIAVAATWLPVVTATGVSLDAVALLVALGSALSLHWWRKRRIPNTSAFTVATVEAPAVDVYAERWSENLGAPGCELAGSRLESPEEIKAGARYVLRLVPGKQSYGQIMGLLEKVRSGLELLPDHDMIVEKHPLLAASCLQFTVVTRSPIKASIVHPGPSAFDPKTGCVDLGPFVDGEGVARWKAYTKNRFWGGYLQGGTGSGKSRMIEGIALSLASSDTHPTVVWYADGQGGASSPLLMKWADHKARTHEQTHAMLAGVLLVMELRQDENALEELEGFTPELDRPGLLGILDECQKPLSKFENPRLAEHTQYLIATIAREGGKVGVALILASQQSTLDAFGGAGNNAEAIRSNLLMGNGVILRSKDNNARQVFGVAVNPKDFPPIQGYAFLVDPDEGARSAPFRGYYVTDDLRARWPQSIDWKSLDVGAANAYGRDYLRRRELAEEAREAIRRRVAARRAGQPATAKPTTAPTVGFDGAAAIRTFGIAEFPVWDPAKFKPAPRPAVRAMHDGHHKVLRAIGDGHRSPKSIRMATGYSERQVHNLLGELLDDLGKIRKSSRGDYELQTQAA